MKSIVIGGTSGLGKYISEELIPRGSEVITLSRSSKGLANSIHFQCDVSDNSELCKILEYIKEINPVIDSLWCIAGYAYPMKIEEQTLEVYQHHFNRNITYVTTAIRILEESLMKSTTPFVVTFGSQWSYRSVSECPELTPYANAKRALRSYTHTFALRNERIRANHYCIPTCDTPAYRVIEGIFRNIQGMDVVRSHLVLAQPPIIVNKLVEHALNFKNSGKTLICEPTGLIYPF